MNISATVHAPSQTQKWDDKADDELLDCIAKASDDVRALAFSAFYHRHQKYLYSICYNLVNRYQFAFLKDEQDDLFQETMMKAYKHAGSFRAEGVTNPHELEHRADAWLGGIAKNALFDLLRRKVKCVSIESEEFANVEWQNPSEPDQGEVELLQGPSTLELIRAAVESLPAKQREALWASSLFYKCQEHQRAPSEQLDDVVRGMGMSKASFRKNTERARKAVRDYVVARQTNAAAK